NAIPSDNYFLNGFKTYNYYILWYIVPATIYNLLNKQAEITGVVSIVSLLNIPVSCALVYDALLGFVTKSEKRPLDVDRLSFVFVTLLLFAYSYHWVFFALTQIAQGATHPALARVLQQMGPVSTSWYKDLLFQPHSILALMQLLLLMRLA